MEELDKTKENLIVDKQPKNIDLSKKALFDLLENKEKSNDKSKEKKSEDPKPEDSNLKIQT